MTHQQVAEGFVNSVEHREDEVDAYYEEFLHRAPDPASALWVDAMVSGASEEAVVEGFLDSPEYQAAHADSTTFVDDLYLDVLGRQSDPAGLAGWQAALDAGMSREAIEAAFVASAEASDQLVTSFYAAYLHRPREQGTSEAWVDLLESPGGSATDAAVGILASPEYIQDASTPRGPSAS